MPGEAGADRHRQSVRNVRGRKGSSLTKSFLQTIGTGRYGKCHLSPAPATLRQLDQPQAQARFSLMKPIGSFWL